MATNPRNAVLAALRNGDVDAAERILQESLAKGLVVKGGNEAAHLKSLIRVAIDADDKLTAAGVESGATRRQVLGRHMDKKFEEMAENDAAEVLRSEGASVGKKAVAGKGGKAKSASSPKTSPTVAGSGERSAKSTSGSVSASPASEATSAGSARVATGSSGAEAMADALRGGMAGEDYSPLHLAPERLSLPAAGESTTGVGRGARFAAAQERLANPTVLEGGLTSAFPRAVPQLGAGVTSGEVLADAALAASNANKLTMLERLGAVGTGLRGLPGVIKAAPLASLLKLGGYATLGATGNEFIAKPLGKAIHTDARGQGALSGVAIGAGLGAGIGSIAPGIGTGVGAVAGGAIGGLVGAIHGGGGGAKGDFDAHSIAALPIADSMKAALVSRLKMMKAAGYPQAEIQQTMRQAAMDAYERYSRTQENVANTLALQAQTSKYFAPYVASMRNSGDVDYGIAERTASSLPESQRASYLNDADIRRSQSRSLADAYALQQQIAPSLMLADQWQQKQSQTPGGHVPQLADLLAGSSGLGGL